MEAKTAPKTLEEILGRNPEERRQEVILSVRDLRVHFPAGGGSLWDKLTGGSATPQLVKAVDGVTLDIYEGESLGLVGESGCGKTTLGRAIMRLVEATSGTIFLRDTPLSNLSDSEMRPWRRHLQMIFQDPYASLNPRMTVGQIVGEPLETFNLASGQAAERWVQSLLEMVGLNKRFVKRYPHEFSGGQRQRIGIARALAASPDLIVADEPISALDVSIQAQVMNLLKNLQKQKTFACLFISHDLRAVRHFSDRIAVMYLGRIVEIGKAHEVYEQPLMPYTQALISAVPVPDPDIEKARQRIALQGEVPSPLNPPTGCHFHPRCPFAIEACSYTEPELLEIKPGHFAACIRISREQPIIEEAKEFAANQAALISIRLAEVPDSAGLEAGLTFSREERRRRRAHEEALLKQSEIEETARLTALIGEKQEDDERQKRAEAEFERIREAEESLERELGERRHRETVEAEQRRVESEQARIRAEQERIRQLEAETRRQEAEETGRRERANQELDKLRLQVEEAERLRNEAEAAVLKAEEERKKLSAQTGNMPLAEAKSIEEENIRRQKKSQKAARKAVEARLAQTEIERRQRETESRLQREEMGHRIQEESKRLEREEEIRQRRAEIERLQRVADEQRRIAEAEQIRQEEEERLRRKAEEERLQSEAEAESKRLEEEKLRREELARLVLLEAEIEGERLEREAEDKQRLLETERLQQSENERLELQAAEEARSRAAEEQRLAAEKDRFLTEEQERLRRVEEEIRQQEASQQRLREAEEESRRLNEQRLKEEQERIRNEGLTRQREEESTRQQKLATEQQRLEEERQRLDESRRRAEMLSSQPTLDDSVTLAAKNNEESERVSLLAEVERLKREAEEALRRQREAEEALRREKRMTGELDSSQLRTARPGNLGSYITPEPVSDQVETLNDRKAELNEPHPHSTLFPTQTVPARSTGVGGKGIALLALGAAVLIGLAFWAAVRYSRTGPAMSIKQDSGATASNTNTTNNPELKTSNPQNPPPGMVYLPGGTFKMGRDDGDDYEKPAHYVTVKPIFMDIYEVTNADYLKFVQATNYQPPPTWKGANIPEGAERKPVTGITYFDAEAYTKWVGKRLPTEEEWEFAARGTDGRLFPWGGDKLDKDQTLAKANAASKALTDVGTFKDGVSPFGIYDMAGNAWEWTSTPLAAYPEGTLPEVPVKETMVIRGGCYLSGLDGVATTYRGFYRKSGEESYEQTGFRCVKDLD